MYTALRKVIGSNILVAARLDTWTELTIFYQTPKQHWQLFNVPSNCIDNFLQDTYTVNSLCWRHEHKWKLFTGPLWQHRRILTAHLNSNDNFLLDTGTKRKIFAGHLDSTNKFYWSPEQIEKKKLIKHLNTIDNCFLDTRTLNSRQPDTWKNPENC